jgi:hypothetical protein
LNHAERLFFGEDRRVAVSHEVRWPAHGVRRVDGEGLGTLLTFVDDATSRLMQHDGPRSSNQACSEPSICTSSPRQSHRRRG